MDAAELLTRVAAELATGGTGVAGRPWAARGWFDQAEGWLREAMAAIGRPVSARARGGCAALFGCGGCRVSPQDASAYEEWRVANAAGCDSEGFVPWCVVACGDVRKLASCRGLAAFVLELPT